VVEFVINLLILYSLDICHVRNFRTREISKIHQSLEQRDQEMFINRLNEVYIITIR
jgi:hypothetical protein